MFFVSSLLHCTFCGVFDIQAGRLTPLALRLGDAPNNMHSLSDQLKKIREGANLAPIKTTEFLVHVYDTDYVNTHSRQYCACALTRPRGSKFEVVRRRAGLYMYFYFSWRKNVVGYGVRKHTQARGVWRHASPGKF